MADDRIRIVVEACLRHGIHRSAGFEGGGRGGAQAGYRERIGNAMGNMHSQDARAELLEKLQSVSGVRGAAGAAGEGGGGGAGGMAGGLAAVGGVLRSQAESVGQMLEQGAGQMRERLGARR